MEARKTEEETDAVQISHLSLKLSPPPIKVLSSASMKPSSPLSLKALSSSRLTRFFSSIPALPISFGPTISSTRSLSSARSLFRFRRSSAVCRSSASSSASTRSALEGRAGPSTLLELEEDEAPPCLEDSTSRRATRMASESALDVFDAKFHLYPVVGACSMAPWYIDSRGRAFLKVEAHPWRENRVGHTR
jgi:hypothetical protein